ncbi:MAG: phage shock protein operon transcriptional activator [Robiginitomaculum sp.]|nr:phage shock protein operon transcriptional activator [Robiginitomaculum sp.]
MLSENTLPPLIGQSVEFLASLDQVSKAANLNRPLLIIGERGTGKELMAARVHFLSGRWSEDYVTVNCAALSDNLLESELFGHEAGAFTGATKRHIGRFERADKGTLFLDEISSASVRVQEKILRVVEYGEFERVGGGQPKTCNVRLIGATNLDLQEQVKKGLFRADLLDRLAFEVVTLPPLRARWEDIPILAQHFGQNMVRELGGEQFTGFSMQAMQVLMQHSWPGNVRELKNVIERNIHYSASSNNDANVFVDEIKLDPFASPWRPQATTISNNEPVAVKQNKALPEPRIDKSFIEQVLIFERVLLRRAMDDKGQSCANAARSLGLSYDQMRHYLQKHKLLGKRKTNTG